MFARGGRRSGVMRLGAALALGLLKGATSAVPVLAAAPANDLMSRPVVIPSSATVITASTTNVDATFGNEPTPSCQTIVGRSIWYRYRPDAPMRVLLYSPPRERYPNRRHGSSCLQADIERFPAGCVRRRQW